RRDVDPPSVHLEVTVAHELPALRARGHVAQAEHHVVEPPLEQRHQVLALHAFERRGLVDRLAELALQHAVDAAHLLLLAQLLAVVGELRPALAVLTRRVVAPLDGALVREAAVALQEQLHALAAAEPTDGVVVTCQADTPKRGAAWVRGSRCAGSESRLARR